MNKFIKYLLIFYGVVYHAREYANWSLDYGALSAGLKTGIPIFR